MFYTSETEDFGTLGKSSLSIYSYTSDTPLQPRPIPTFKGALHPSFYEPSKLNPYNELWPNFGDALPAERRTLSTVISFTLPGLK